MPPLARVAAHELERDDVLPPARVAAQRLEQRGGVARGGGVRLGGPRMAVTASPR